jgi:hypothetical protein
MCNRLNRRPALLRGAAYPLVQILPRWEHDDRGFRIGQQRVRGGLGIRPPAADIGLGKAPHLFPTMGLGLPLISAAPPLFPPAARARRLNRILQVLHVFQENNHTCFG